MESEIQQKEVKSEESAKTSTGAPSGNVEQADDIIERAKRQAAELKAENERLERNLAELRKLRTEQIMGGGSYAGSVEKTPEQKMNDEDEAYAKRLTDKYFPTRRVRL